MTAAFRENIKGIIWNHEKPTLRRSDRAGRLSPHYIPDQMDPTMHMADGRMYDSKSRFREVTKAHNCIEVGNEVQRVPKPVRNPGAGADIKRAIEQLRGR